MDYVGGAAIWKFTTISSQSSILAQNSVIEYDGQYYWIGIDRFMYFDSAVHELPNDMNQNWFFDNLNYAQRQKIWATKITRFGEVIWHYPRGTSEECNATVIFNVRLKTWYDCSVTRSAGFYSQVRQFPLWAGQEISPQHRIQVTSGTATGGSTTHLIDAGQSFVTLGVKNGDTIQLNSNEPNLTVTNVTPTDLTCTASVASYSGQAYVITRNVEAGVTYNLYQHEFGNNAVNGDVESAIQSYYTTQNFSYLTGGVGDSVQGPSFWTRLTRIEPDFIQTGEMTVTVIGYEFAQSPPEPEVTYFFGPNTGKVDTRVQRRHILLRFESNILNGFYESGKVLIHTELGDLRS
jgi:hypothetical protein